MAETYNTLTRLNTYAFPAVAAFTIVEQVSQHLTLVTLTSDETLETLRLAAKCDILGPQIFDALLIACGRKANSTNICTYNVRHFQQIAPDLADRISKPQSSPIPRTRQGHSPCWCRG
jgi:predicted nucleic acid-binding protein